MKPATTVLSQMPLSPWSNAHANPASIDWISACSMCWLGSSFVGRALGPKVTRSRHQARSQGSLSAAQSLAPLTWISEPAAVVIVKLVNAAIVLLATGEAPSRETEQLAASSAATANTMMVRGRFTTRWSRPLLAWDQHDPALDAALGESVVRRGGLHERHPLDVPLHSCALGQVDHLAQVRD